MLDILTISRLRTFRTCARKHDLRYRRHFVPARQRESLTIGNLFHEGAESWWNMDDLGFALGAIEAEATKQKADAKSVVIAREMLIGYVASWAPERPRYQVLEVEKEFRAPLINPDTMSKSQTYEIGGKIDLILRERATGATCLVEHKTTSDDISDDSAHYFKKLALDGQLSLYHVGAQSLGYAIDKVIYDVAAKPGFEMKTATPIESRKYTKDGKLYANQRDRDETVDEFAVRVASDILERPARYFRRVEVVRLEDEIKESMRDVWYDARIIRESELAERAPRNPDACTQFGTCEYFDVCAYGIDPARSALYVKKAPHSELSFSV